MSALDIPRSPGNPWEVWEKYADGQIKTWRHNGTGEILGAKAYRTRKRNGTLNLDANPVPDLDASPDIEPPPPPPVTMRSRRAWQEYGTAPDPEAPEGSDQRIPISTFWQMGSRGLYNIGKGVSKFVLVRFMERPDLANYIPPTKLVTPVLTPIARIMDRHMPVSWAAQGSADFADLLAAINAADALGDWFAEVAAANQELYYGGSEDEDEDEEEGEQEPYEQPAPRTGRSDRTPTGRERKPRSGASQALQSLETWRLSTRSDNERSGLGRRNGRRSPGGNDDRNHSDGGSIGFSADGADDPNQVARNAASVRDLLAADANGRFMRGLG